MYNVYYFLASFCWCNSLILPPCVLVSPFINTHKSLSHRLYAHIICFHHLSFHSVGDTERYHLLSTTQSLPIATDLYSALSAGYVLPSSPATRSGSGTRGHYDEIVLETGKSPALDKLRLTESCHPELILRKSIS